MLEGSRVFTAGCVVRNALEYVLFAGRFIPFAPLIIFDSNKSALVNNVGSKKFFSQSGQRATKGLGEIKHCSLCQWQRIVGGIRER